MQTYIQTYKKKERTTSIHKELKTERNTYKKGKKGISTEIQEDTEKGNTE